MRYFPAAFLLAFLFYGVSSAGAFESPPPPPPAPKPVQKTGPQPIIVLPPPPGKKTVLPDSDEYKKDKAYRAIQQYDYLSYWLERETEEEISDAPVRDTVKVFEKPFVLAGEGFKIPQKGFLPGPEFRSNPYTHIDVDVPQSPFKKPMDAFDYSENRVRSQRPLIFRSRHAGYYNLPDGMKDFQPEKQIKPPESPRPISQTHLHLSADGDTRLTLGTARQLDLLHRNEKLNRVEYFKNW